MKKTLFILLLFSNFIIQAQIGIGTDNPSCELEVIGGTLIESYLEVTNNSSTNGNYFLLARSKDSYPVGEIKKLNPELLEVAPINIYNVELQNVNLDQVKNLDTGLDADNYFISIVNARFSGATSSAFNDLYYGAFTSSVRQIDGKNKITLDFSGSDTVSGINGNWNLTFIIYEKIFIHNFGSFQAEVTAATGYKGTANTTPLSLQ